MAGFARLYESLGPLYKGNASPTQSAAGDTPKKPDGGRKFEPAEASSDRKHPAPGRMGGSARQNRPSSGSDDDNFESKNSSAMSYRARPASIESSQPIGGSEAGIKGRLSSPRPAAALSSTRQDPESSLARRSSLRAPSGSGAGGGSDGDTRSSSSRRTAAVALDDGQAKRGSSASYDRTDNMRLPGSYDKKLGKNDSSSSEGSDSETTGATRRSGMSPRRQGSSPQPSSLKPSYRSALTTDSLRQRGLRDSDGDDIPARRQREGKDSLAKTSPSVLKRREEIPSSSGSKDFDESKDSSPLNRSASHGEPLNRRRDLARDKYEDPERRRSPIGRSNSPPLGSASRDESLIRRRNLAGKTDKDEQPLRRNILDDSSSDTPSPKPTYREELLNRRQRSNLDDRSFSPPLRSTSLEKPLSWRKDATSDKDELPLRRRRNMEDTSEKSLRSTSREEPLNRRKDLLIGASEKDELPARRNRNLGGQSDSPPLRSTGEEPLKPPLRSPARGEPLNRQRGLAHQSHSDDSSSDSPSPRSTSREELLNRLKDQTAKSDKNELPVRRGRNLGGRSDSPPLRSTGEEPLNRRRNLADANKRDLSPQSGAPSSRDDLSVRGRKALDDRSVSRPLASSDSSPPRSTSRDNLSPRRRYDLDASPSQRSSLGAGKLGNLRSRNKDLDESSDSPPQRPERDPLRGRADPSVRKGRDDLSPPLRSTSRKDLADLEPSPRAGPKSRESLSPRQDDAPSKLHGKDPTDRSRPSYKSSEVRKDADQPKDPRGLRTSSSDKEQPKSGVLKRSEPSDSFARDRGVLGKKKASSDESFSDSDSPRGKKDTKHGVGAARQAIRLETPGKGGRSRSPPDRVPFGQSPRDEASLKLGGKGIGPGAPAPLKHDLAPKSRDDPSLRSPRSREKDIPPRVTAKDLSPRRSNFSDDKKAASSRFVTKAVSSDNLTAGRQRQLGKDLSPRSGAVKPGSLGDRGEKYISSPRTHLGLKPGDTRRTLLDDENDAERDRWTLRRDQPLRRTDADDKHALSSGQDAGNFRRRPGLNDEIGSRRQTDLDFARQEQKLSLIKLKRPLPVNLSGTRYELVQQAARHIGFAQSADDDFKTPFLIWTDSFISAERLTQLKQFQRVNHIPGMAEISRKDLLARNLAKLTKLHPGEYNFAPRSWCFPGELGNFQQYVKELQKGDKKQPTKAFICKPIDGSSGKGIKVYKTADDVPQAFESECVLQEYISNPFLIENVKFDLRLYVLVTSCDPLRVYFYNEGFVRMSSEPYVDPSQWTQDDAMAFMHLTNSSINKLNPSAEATAGRRRTNIGGSLGGNKRSIRFLNEYLQKHNYDVALVWRNIVDLMLKTVFAAYPHVIRSYRQCRPADSPASGSVCFEILGFDIMLDAKLKPWLLEVNRSPNFDAVVTAERDVKLQLLEETLMLLNVSPSDRKRAGVAPPSNLGGVGSAKEQKELADLAALLARLKRQARMREADARICQRYRRIFPADDIAKQEKLAALLVGALPVLLDASSAPLQREVEAFYSNKLTIDQVAQQLAKRSSASSVQQMTAADSSGDSSSDEEGSLGRDGRRRGGTRYKDSKTTDSKSSKDAAKAQQKQQKQKQQRLRIVPDDNSSQQYELQANQALKFLNHLSIRFPGKSHREAEKMLRGLQNSWPARKAEVGAYWRLSLDADKRRRVLDIARQNVRFALDKALRRGATTTAAGPSEASGAAAATAAPDGAARLTRLFEKLYNRLLWCNGQGLWETFSGRAAWEGILRQSRKAPTEAEINCCRRVVQLCQDCLFIVFLYSDAAHQLRQEQPLPPKQQPLPPKQQPLPPKQQPVPPKQQPLPPKQQQHAVAVSS